MSNGKTKTFTRMLLSTASSNTILFSKRACSSNNHGTTSKVECVEEDEFALSDLPPKHKEIIYENVEGVPLTCRAYSFLSLQPSMNVNITQSVAKSVQLQAFPNLSVFSAATPSNVPSLDTTVTFVDDYSLPTHQPSLYSMESFSGITGLAGIYSLSSTFVLESSEGDSFVPAPPAISGNFMTENYSSFPDASLAARTLGSALHYDLPYIPSFGLDLNIVLKKDKYIKKPSFLTLDGIPSIYSKSSLESQSKSMIFTPRQVLPGKVFSNAPVFNIEDILVCSSSLFPKKGPIPVLLDSSTACMSLPSDIFDTLIPQIPVICDIALKPTIPGGNKICYYDHALSIDGKLSPVIMPYLSFHVNEDEGEEEDKKNSLLEISLSSLLLPSGVGGGPNPEFPQETRATFQRLCIHRVDEPHITFGTLAMSTFYIHITPYSVGLVNKLAQKSLVDEEVRNSRCPTTLLSPCIGQQVLYRGMNTCVDPNCSEYLLFSLDPFTRTCRISPSFYVIILVIFLAYVLYEVITYCVESRLDAVMQSSTAMLRLKPLFRGPRAS